QVADPRVDVAVVGHVIATVPHRRAVERRQPDGVDAEVAEVWQARRETGHVADAVTVAIGEAADVDLVDHRGAPPLGGLHEIPLESNRRREAPKRRRERGGQRRATPVEPRTTSSGRKTYSECGAGCPLTASVSARTAALDMARTGWRSVDSGGSVNGISAESS